MNSDSSPSSSPQSNTISVVIVEDDVSVRPLLAEWIQEEPHFTLLGQFPDAESATPIILRSKPNIALLDINLPGLSGIDLVRRLKPRLPETQFVMLTIYEDANHIFEALSTGATGYLSKRTPRDALIAALHDVHAGGSPMSSSIARKIVQSFQRKSAKSEPIDQLSKRETEVLELLAQGHTYKHIADAMNVSLATVSTYARRIYEKLQVNSRGQAVAIYADLAVKKKS
ncbi:MAG TPA: response regulator transcription factor [Opitutaceae bacterium]|nr:response regulator transcription factor [Opitutaceae bacterium]